MARDFARKFYSSQAWNNCRESYMAEAHHLCERCMAKGVIKPAAIVHHKIELTPENINNPLITLDHKNLQAVCRECHSEIHYVDRRKRRYYITNDGRVLIKETELQK